VRVTVEDADGASHDVAELRSTLTVRQLGPFSVALQHTGPGEYVAQAVQLPYSGTWQLRVTVRTSDIDATTVATPINIR
ncbi:MAG TPA: FixH family protein, partial [Pseudonocardiaceae bacterium]|nr:FixH family protein [Pseudonocardiaceae bacterium]